MKAIARSLLPRRGALGRPAVDRSATGRNGSRGQVVVIFAGAAFVLLRLDGARHRRVVVLGEYPEGPASRGRGSLAGAVWLPGDAVTAASTPGPRRRRTGIRMAPAESPSRRHRTPRTAPARCAGFGTRRHVLHAGYRDQLDHGDTHLQGLYVLPVPMAAPLPTTVSATSTSTRILP